MAKQPEDFSVDVTEEDGRVVVVPRGELDIVGAPELEEIVLGRSARAATSRCGWGQLEFMDSSGVRVLVAGDAASQLEGAGRSRSSTRAPGTTVARILDVSGVDTGLGVVAPDAA